MAVGDKTEKVLSLNGALFCTPVAFLYPSMFHLKACATGMFQKMIDVAIIGISIMIMVYCTIMGIIQWNDV